MAHFRATIRGQKGEASRLGTKLSGMVITLNGWNIGLKAYITHNKKEKKDEILLIRTGGSNGIKQEETIGRIKEE